MEAALCLELGREETNVTGSNWPLVVVQVDELLDRCCCCWPVIDGGGLPQLTLEAEPDDPWPAKRGPPDGINDSGEGCCIKSCCCWPTDEAAGW